MNQKEISELVQLAQNQLQFQTDLDNQLILQLDFFQDQLFNLKKIVQPLCASSETTLTYSSNLQKLSELLNQLQEIERENATIISNIWSSLQQNKLNTDGLQKLLQNRAYLSQYHPEFQIAQLDSTINAVCAQFSLQFSVNTFQFAQIEQSSTQLFIQKQSKQTQSQLQALQGIIPVLQVQTHLQQFNSNQIKSELKSEVLSTDVYVNMQLMFDLPSKFYVMMKEFVKQKRTHMFKFVNQYALCNGIMIKQQNETACPSYADVYHLYYLDLIKTLDTFQKEDATVDEDFKCYFTNKTPAAMKAQQILMLQFQERASWNRRQYRKICNSKSMKSSYTPPQIGYQSESHPLASLFITLLKTCAQLRTELVQFFTYCVHRSQGGTNGFYECNITQIGEDIQKHIMTVAESMFVSIVGPAVENFSQLVVEYATQSKDIQQNLHPTLDLIQIFNVLINLSLKTCFDFKKWQYMTDFIIGKIQRQETTQLSQLYQNVIKSYFPLLVSQNNQLNSASDLIKQQFSRAFNQLLHTGAVLQNKFDYYLFPTTLKPQENTLVIAQASIILNQLQQLQFYIPGQQLLSDYKKVEKTSKDPDDSDTEVVEFTFNISIRPEPGFEQAEKRIWLFVQTYLTPKPNATPQQILQRMNTLGYVYEYLTDSTNVLSQSVSNSFKDQLELIIKQQLSCYRELFDSVCRKLKPNLLGDALIAVFSKWLQQNLYGVTEQDLQRIRDQVTGFQNRREDLRAPQEEYSDESKVSGLDLDQQTESGFSVQETQSEKFVVGGVKVKAKRVKTVISDNLSKFYKELHELLSVHKDFYCVSKNVGKMMKKVFEESVVKQLEFYQNVCYCSLVSQRYYDEERKENAQDLYERAREIFGQ
ncbi:Conserved_hypothetical protein [Hexamita inflata]|uniref:Uncharacterized protein n=1 Tax=Hexamita inflata TaxID=28002 RepID=A0AA86NR51_9EUKA|nr:Conserved hypothetical protein [Hexamita inflata]